MKRSFTSFGFSIFAATATLMLLTCAASAKLTIGDPAPKLQPAKWVQGEPVIHFDSNHVYIVEFWATWCGPCRASIPHLNALYEKFKGQGLIAIGQDISEQNDSGVASFVKKMGDQMTYRVALDDKSRNPKGIMATTWMKAADQHAIPTAFVINRHGKIAWIGHPMTLTDDVLKQILADKFDTAAFSKKYEKARAERKARMEKYNQLSTAMREKNWDKAEAALAELEKDHPETAEIQFGGTRVKILLGRGDEKGAYELAQSLSEKHVNNAFLQNELAWTLATTKGVNQQGLALAKLIAQRANTAAGGKQAAILDTLARVQFMTGQTNEAVVTEQKAVDLAPEGMESYLKQFLNDYQQGKLPGGNQ